MEKSHGLVFSTAEIREKGGLTLKKALDPEFFADVLEGPAKVANANVDLVFSVGGDSLLLEGAVEAGLHLECARCGEPFTGKFTEPFDELYEDAVESIDVSGTLRDSVALMMPLKPLCSPQCKGLCQACGGNLNLKVCGCVTGQEAEFSEAKKEGPFKDLKRRPRL
ncbi:MAG: hypothetical protein A2270_01595 [Elusimicrobia bacterium RIFOXYA12_FULL_51_18]|nr:MAG: hypothetical protein A2270_01595 [Elusimicrobia bacterium RIFOXYA12_FULL_51_18]OGS29604.1 MAG: hypothetical protein A2218_01200 [Elusimicrobia bacterium RIFOXYA2_FULL_53_38]